MNNQLLLTYTVRPLATQSYLGAGVFRSQKELANTLGCVVTVRQGTKVVKQFPRVSSDRAGHKLAQLWIKGMKS